MWTRTKCFLKYFALAVAVQIAGGLILGCLATIFPALNFLVVAGFYFYTPTIALIWVTGAFKGEAALVWPIGLGVPLGILLYSFVFARLWTYLSQRRGIVQEKR